MADFGVKNGIFGVEIPQIEISEFTKKPQNASKAILKMSLLLDENRADFGVKSLDLEYEIFTSSFFWGGKPQNWGFLGCVEETSGGGEIRMEIWGHFT